MCFPQDFTPSKICGLPLKAGTEPINLRPYRYSYVQKTEMGKIVEELLDQSVIRPSKSPFAAPALLVKKKDGSWRMCVYYRKLNSATIHKKEISNPGA